MANTSTFLLYAVLVLLAMASSWVGGAPLLRALSNQPDAASANAAEAVHPGNTAEDDEEWLDLLSHAAQRVQDDERDLQANSFCTILTTYFQGLVSCSCSGGLFAGISYQCSFLTQACPASPVGSLCGSLVYTGTVDLANILTGASLTNAVCLNNLTLTGGTLPIPLPNGLTGGNLGNLCINVQLTVGFPGGIKALSCGATLGNFACSTCTTCTTASGGKGVSFSCGSLFAGGCVPLRFPTTTTKRKSIVAFNPDIKFTTVSP